MMKPQLIAVFIIGFLASLTSTLKAGDPNTRIVSAARKAEKLNPEITRLFAEAHKLSDSGRYRLAYKRYDQILEIDPNCAAARKGQEEAIAAGNLFEYSRDFFPPPSRNMPAVAANIPASRKIDNSAHQVQRLFIEAKAFYDSARFDLAYKRYNQILEIDPTNTAARKGQEEVIAARLKYEEGEYAGGHTVSLTIQNPDQKIADLKRKLNRIIIPKIDFKDAPLREVIAYLHRRSVELDTAEPSLSLKGVNIVLDLQSASGAGEPPVLLPEIPLPKGTGPSLRDSAGNEKITLSLRNMPLSLALGVISKLAGLEVKVGPLAVTLAAPTSPHAENPDSNSPTAANSQPDGESAGAWSPRPRQYGPLRHVAPVDKSLESIQNKLNRTVIPQIKFQDASVRDAVEFLRRKSIELDTTESDPALKGVNIILKLEPAPDASPATAPGTPAVPANSIEDKRLTLSLANIPLSEALRYVAELGTLKIEIASHAVILTPLSEPTGTPPAK